MGIGKHIVPGGGEAEVSARHLVVLLHVDTTFGQYADGQGIGIVGIMVEPRVVLSDDGIAHSTIGLCLVRIVFDLMLTRRGEVGDRGQRTQLERAEWFPLQLALELHADFVQVDVVVVELVLDIERSVVARIILVGIHRARRVECKAEGVDVEIALHLAVDDIDRLAEGARLALLAVVAVADEVQRQLLRHLD